MQSMNMENRALITDQMVHFFSPNSQLKIKTLGNELSRILSRHFHF